MRAKKLYVSWLAGAGRTLSLGAVALGALVTACVEDSVSDADRTPVGRTSQALFANVDFEADTANLAPSSWTIDPRLYFGYGSTGGSGSNVPPASLSVLDLRTSPNGSFTAVANTLVLSGGTTSQRDADLVAKFADATNDKFRFPKYGTKSAVINYNPGQRGNANQIGRNHNANVMSASMTFSPADIDPSDGQLHVRFVYAPIVQSGGHGLNQQPFVAVKLTKVGTDQILYEDFVAASTKGAPWLATGSGATDPYYFGPMDPADHVAGWKVVDIIPGSANVQLGDAVKLEIVAAGCYATAHWGRVYVDAFGVAIPDLYVIAHGVQAANEDTDITYTYTYKNGGSGTAVDAYVDFAIPQGTTFKSVDLAGCTQKTFADPRTAAGLPGGPYPDIELHTCPVGDVAPGGSGSFRVVAHVDPGTAGQVDVNGHYSSYASNVDPLVGPDIRTTVTSGVAYADVSSTISSGLAAAAPGDALTYTAVVQNHGPSTASNVGVAVATTNTTLGAWTCTGGGGAVCPAPSGTGAFSNTGVNLPVGGKLTYVIAAVAGSAGTAVTRVDATVNAPNADSDSSNNSAAELLQLGAVRDVTVSKGKLGTVRSAPATLDCGLDCRTQTRRFLDGSTVILEATPPPGGAFLGWTGDCSGTAPTCTLVANANKQVGARFVGPATELVVTGGNRQSTSVLTAFPQPLALKVVDADGTGIPGVGVTLAAPPSGASATLASTSLTTDAQGNAQSTATANDVQGAFGVTAKSGALEATFSLRNVEPAGAVSVLGGSPQEKVVGEVFDAPLVVEVRDYKNQPRANALVRFEGPSSGATASFSTPVARTGADGRASVRARAGLKAGSYAVGVIVDNVTMPASIALTNLPGAPATIRALHGSDRQAARIATAFARPLHIRVSDAYDNPVPSVGVAFNAPAAEPRAVVDGAATTAANGEAEVKAVAGAVAGSYITTAVVTGTQLKADFALTNLLGSPVVVKAVSGTPQTATVDTDYGAPLVVVVTRDDQPLVDTLVSFSAPNEGPSARLAAPSSRTGADGRTSLVVKAGTKAGAFEVTAFTAEGAQPALFSLENVAGAAAKISADPVSTPQNAMIDTAFAEPLRARVTDAFGNPVAGVTVTYAAPTTGPSASLGQATAVTDAAGIAAVPATAGEAAGTYLVTGTVPGVSESARFSLGNLLEAPAHLAAMGSGVQSAVVLTAFEQPLAVEAVDGAGAPLANVPVSFVVAADGPSASLEAGTKPTDAAGGAGVGATANGEAGEHVVIATIPNGAAPVQFLLTNLPGAGNSLRVEAGSDQAAPLGSAYPHRLRARLTDANGNPVRGVAITFAAPSNGPTALLSELIPTTNADGAVDVFGIAAVAPGTFELPVTAPGNAGATFSLTNEALARDDGALEGGGFSCATSAVAGRSSTLTAFVFAVGAVLARRLRRKARR